LPADPDEAPPLPQTPDSQPGEIYQLGPHALLCGDATDADGLGRLLAGVTPEVLMTDPPYGVSYTGKTRRALTIANDNSDAVGVFGAALRAVDPLLAPSARFYVYVPGGPLGAGFRQCIDDAGWRLHQTLVWVKDRFVLGHGDHQLQHEDILYGWRPGPGRPGRGRHQGSRWQGGNNQSSVFFVDRPARSEEHPTMKPVALIAAQLSNSSRRGDAVLDPFAGSGSALIACEQLGRRCFAVELDPGYCDVIRQRYEEYVHGH
jgi:DNA modification methylase